MPLTEFCEFTSDKHDLGDGKRPLTTQHVRRLDPPKAIITILDPEDINTWLHGTYDEIVALQKPYDPARMTVRGPVFPTRRPER
ncbi:hypothetical protein [Sphingomonas sp. NIC1]|uniref:hypothetical protein n=1 Tax=Sphingomonas sp. NIC1 TaxID=1961362 RepID=UPI0007C0E817|nr:hypothetical protein A7E77_16665 [Sphingomonas sp. NIC1]